jgi:tRNA threonylcarbamoyladenosine biosynthesis protein TsaB
MTTEHGPGHGSWLLGIDASTPRSVVVVGRIRGEHDVLVAEHDGRDDGPNQASAHLVDRIAAVLATAGVPATGLAAVACGRGPGTFTGVRVALATAKGLAVGAGVPLVPVSTLHALALSSGAEGLVLPLLDARRDEVYAALVRLRTSPNAQERVQTLLEEQVAGLDHVIGRALDVADGPVIAVGSGADLHADTLRAAGCSVPLLGLSGPTAAGLFAALATAWRQGAAIDPADVEATYLRKSYAELGIHAPKRPFVPSPFVSGASEDPS